MGCWQIQRGLVVQRLPQLKPQRTLPQVSFHLLYVTISISTLLLERYRDHLDGQLTTISPNPSLWTNDIDVVLKIDLSKQGWARDFREWGELVPLEGLPLLTQVHRDEGKLDLKLERWQRHLRVKKWETKWCTKGIFSWRLLFISIQHYRPISFLSKQYCCSFVYKVKMRNSLCPWCLWISCEFRQKT